MPERLEDLIPSATIAKLRQLQAFLEEKEANDTGSQMYSDCWDFLRRKAQGKPPYLQGIAGREVEFVELDQDGNPLPGQQFRGEIVATFREPREGNAIDVRVVTTARALSAPRIDHYLRLYPSGYAEIRTPYGQRQFSEVCWEIRPDQFLRQPTPSDRGWWRNTVNLLTGNPNPPQPQTA